MTADITDKAETNAPADPVAALLGGRRTIHQFQSDVPPRALLDEALALARWAPNHHLSEPWRFYLLGRDTATAIAELNAELVEAKQGPDAARAKRERWLTMPGWLAVTCERSDDPLRQREDYAACCCAIQNMMLYLWSRGVGVKWGTGAVTRDARFYDLLWADPEREETVGLFWYGYPQEVPQLTRQPLASSLVELP